MNITLIGMPGAGKSTVGVILAKLLSYEFVDTDILIQIKHSKTLQEIINESGYMELRKIEENVVCSLDIKDSVISTGGSVVYSRKAMEYLNTISHIVFLDVEYETLLNRVDNFAERGLAKAENQTFSDLYKERQPLYRKYAEFVLNCDSLSQDAAAKKISELVF